VGIIEREEREVSLTGQNEMASERRRRKYLSSYFEKKRQKKSFHVGN